MQKADWNGLLKEAEESLASMQGLVKARELKGRVEQALFQAESTAADAEVINRLDMMLMVLTARSKENVCTNEKCPHYNKKCKMM